MKLRWCVTHDSNGMLKDACVKGLWPTLDRRGGATNMGEVMDGGPKPCVFEDRWLVTEDPS